MIFRTIVGWKYLQNALYILVLKWNIPIEGYCMPASDVNLAIFENVWPEQGSSVLTLVWVVVTHHNEQVTRRTSRVRLKRKKALAGLKLTVPESLRLAGVLIHSVTNAPFHTSCCELSHLFMNQIRGWRIYKQYARNLSNHNLWTLNNDTWAMI